MLLHFTFAQESIITMVTCKSVSSDMGLTEVGLHNTQLRMKKSAVGTSEQSLSSSPALPPQSHPHPGPAVMIHQIPGREVWLKLPEQLPHGQESVPAISLPHSETAECIVEVESFTQLQVQHRELAVESPSVTFSLHS
jgi:hypothetical protein